MNNQPTKTATQSELSPQEQELLTYYRALTNFNQRRVITIARNAYEDARRTLQFRENNYRAHKS